MILVIGLFYAVGIALLVEGVMGAIEDMSND